MDKEIKKEEKRNRSVKRAEIFATFSIVLNICLAVGKFFLACFRGVFFFVSGMINVFWLISKIECYLGLKKKGKRKFETRNTLVAVFVMLAGLQYAIYMLTLIISNRTVMDYGQWLSIGIATVSFIELGMAIYGLCTTKGKGHYFRDLKIINFCSTLTSMIWTEVALLSFTTGIEGDARLICGISGACVGVVIILFGVYILFAPKISLIDREHNVFKRIEGKESLLKTDEGGKIEIMLVKSKIYGSYVYKAKLSDGVVDGHIVKTKSELRKLNIAWKILFIILSEILIFPYAIGAMVYFFRTINVLKKLEDHMASLNFEKLTSDK